MEERERKSCSGVGCVIVGAVLLLFSAVYILFTGPANRVVEHFPATLPFFETIYAPVAFVCERSETVSNAFLWYADLWGGGIPVNDIAPPQATSSGGFEDPPAIVPKPLEPTDPLPAPPQFEAGSRP